MPDNSASLLWTVFLIVWIIVGIIMILDRIGN
jgi:hypothetical protein